MDASLFFQFFIHFIVQSWSKANPLIPIQIHHLSQTYIINNLRFHVKPPTVAQFVRLARMTFSLAQTRSRKSVIPLIPVQILAN